MVLKISIHEVKETDQRMTSREFFMLPNCWMSRRVLIAEYSQLCTNSSHIKLGIVIMETILRSLSADVFDNFEMCVAKVVFELRWESTLSEQGINDGAKGVGKFICKFW